MITEGEFAVMVSIKLFSFDPLRGVLCIIMMHDNDKYLVQDLHFDRKKLGLVIQTSSPVLPHRHFLVYNRLFASTRVIVLLA